LTNVAGLSASNSGVIFGDKASGGGSSSSSAAAAAAAASILAAAAAPAAAAGGLALSGLAASLGVPWSQLASAVGQGAAGATSITSPTVGSGLDAKPGAQTSYKRALCKYFQQSGTCSAGAMCTYAHGTQELTQGYKRNLCKFFQDTGTCSKGSECTFAHGVEELQAG